MLTPVKDIIVLDTSGKILNYACEVVSDGPLNCTTATLRKHLINEITRMIYSGMSEFYADELSECIERRLNTSKKVDVINLALQ